jgi:hypothetical protein
MRSPGEQRFAVAASSVPVPDDVYRSTSVSVRKTCASRSKQRLYTGLKSGPRWWTTGCDMAASTSGGTGVGPGVNK